MKKLILVCIFLIFIGCAGGSLNPNNHTLVVLQNPETKQVVECRGDAWTTWNVYAEVEECAKAYEKAGFVRLGEY